MANSSDDICQAVQKCADASVNGGDFDLDSKTIVLAVSIFITFGLGVFNLFTQRMARKLDHTWGAFKDEIYDPMQLEVKKFDDCAKPHICSATLTKYTKDKRDEYYQEISSARASIEVLCVNADKHQHIKCPTFSAKFKTLSVNIDAAIGKTYDTTANGGGFDDLQKAVAEFSSEMKSRLSQERKDITNG